jgi:DNA-binding response OmpR family regulator
VAVWADIHSHELVLLDLQHEGDEAAHVLRAARDAFLNLLSRISVAVLTPDDDKALERILLEHDAPDYLRAPITPEHVGFLVDQMIRRLEVMGRDWD